MRFTDLYFSWWLRPGAVRSLVVGGRKRTYVVHIPDGRDLTGPVPVVLALHGATMNGPMMAWFSGLNRKADQAGFLVAYPNGTGGNSSFTWNGGNCCGWAMQNKIDDVAFLAALLDDLARAYPIDARRVYVTGMSNGAVMAYRLAAELSERVAAVAPVAGAVGTEVVTPRRPVSVLHFHGTKDEYIPFAGGRGARGTSGTNHRSAEESIRTWVKANGCEGTPATDVLSEGDDGMRVTRTTYAAGREGAKVALVVIEGGGHTWPGQKSPARVLGRSALSISANDLMWEFFRRHPMT
jgi:polyhydroxybutyrate depolymerase